MTALFYLFVGVLIGVAGTLIVVSEIVRRER